VEESFSFTDSKKIQNENIFNYLTTKALSGELKAYQLWDGFEKFDNNVYSEYDKFPQKWVNKDGINFMLSDTLKTIKFHEVFYLDNYSLHCRIISAAPMTNCVTSQGIDLGLQEAFFCCKNTGDVSILNNPNLVHLKTIKRVINFDSLLHSKIIKQTYGMDLSESIWCGASKGLISLLDIKTNKAIDSKNVMNYSNDDSVQNQVVDSNGNFVGYRTIPGRSVFPSELSNMIQFTQDFYYDTKQNVFILTITDCFMFVQYWDEKSNGLVREKMFKVL